MFGTHHFVYMLRCVDGTLFTGVSSDPYTLADAINKGSGPRYAIQRRPVFLVYTEEYMNERDAERRAELIRRMDRTAKEHVLAMATPAVLDEYAFGGAA